MNRTNLLRGALALSIPSLIFACNRTAEERAEEEHERAAEARTEAAEERRENLEERREERAENRVDPKIQPNQPEGREPSTNAANAVKGLTAESVQLITQARCMREEKCGNVGKDEDYASVSICQQKIGADWRQELNSYDCPGGVVTKELNECLEEIKNEDCASPFDTLGRIVACRSSDICKAVE
ncbi:MAG TPA: DUF6184 family natural product biosynthesis lipoprotein [Polyangiaceae bacterium]|nr:DUF6184 family natural product biosynthesis lipoprotein [Polyangiaceae bacterium]